MPINRIIYIFVLSIAISNAHAGICDKAIDPKTKNDWVLSNMCHFENTVLVKVKSDRLRAWYNPLTHFRSPNVFEYEVELIETYKGIQPNTTCMLQSTEATFVISAGISNTRQIISFNEIGECVFIDVAARQETTKELELYAKQIAEQLNNEEKNK